MNEAELHARLSEVTGRRLGASGDIESLTLLTGGGTKHTYAFDVTIEGRRQPLILQMSTLAAPDDASAAFTPRLHPADDARLMQAAGALGVAVPTVRLVLAPEDGLGAGYVTDRIDAEAMGKRIVHDAQYSEARKTFAAECGRNLALIHRIPVADHPALREQRPDVQIEAYAGIVEHYGVRSPALSYALAWARERVPRDGALGVVHGDFRMGNILTDSDGLRCILDWEGAHLSDPMQDLGYLCVHTWRFGGALPVGGVGTREALFETYEAAGGGKVDPLAVQFWEAWGSIKWAIIALRRGLHMRDDSGPMALEHCAIGRRVEEPLWDFFQLVHPGAR